MIAVKQKVKARLDKDMIKQVTQDVKSVLSQMFWLAHF